MISRTSPNNWILDNIPLNNPCVKWKSKWNLGIFFIWILNISNTEYLNLWTEAKAGPGGKVCVYVHILEKEIKVENQLPKLLTQKVKKKNTKLSPKLS